MEIECDVVSGISSIAFTRLVITSASILSGGVFRRDRCTYSVIHFSSVIVNRKKTQDVQPASLIRSISFPNVCLASSDKWSNKNRKKNRAAMFTKPAARLAIFVTHTADSCRRDKNRQVHGGLQRRQATENWSRATIASDRTGSIRC